MRSSKLVKQGDNQIFFAIFVSMLWAKKIILNYVKAAVIKVPFLSVVGEFFIPGIMLLLFLLSFSTIVDRLRGSDFAFIMFFLLLYAGEFVLFRHLRPYFKAYVSELVIDCMPLYFVGVAIRGEDEERILKWLFRISMVTIVLFAVYLFFFHEWSSRFVRGGDMGSAYRLLPHACLVFYCLTEKPTWARGIVSLLSLFLLLFLGTRGAVLCLLVFMCMTLALNTRMRNPLLFLVIAVIILILLIFPSIITRITTSAYSLAQNLGMSTRVFDKALSGELAVSTARVRLKKSILFYLDKAPYTGLGIYGDRFVTNGQYVHNFFFEILCDFGYVGGSLVLLVLGFFLVTTLISALKSGDRNTKLIVLLLIGCSLKLAVSGSYLAEPFFWLMLGYFISFRRDMRNARQESTSTVRVKLQTIEEKPTANR